MRPIKTPHNLLNGSSLASSTSNLSFLPKPLVPTSITTGHFQANLVSAIGPTVGKQSKLQPSNLPRALTIAEPEPQNIANQSVDEPDMIKLANNLTETLTIDAAQSVAGGLSASNSTDLLSASPIFNYSPFDTHSLDELATPDEFAPINFINGLTNINYDFDLSDYSADNSVAEDLDNLKNNIAMPSFVAQAATTPTCATNETPCISTRDLDEFDPLLGNTNDNLSSASNSTRPINFQLGEIRPPSLMDGGDSPSEILLPSPLKPMMSDYRGFSSCEIPTIACNTGDFSSLNFQASTSSQQHDAAKNCGGTYGKQ